MNIDLFYILGCGFLILALIGLIKAIRTLIFIIKIRKLLSDPSCKQKNNEIKAKANIKRKQN